MNKTQINQFVDAYPGESRRDYPLARLCSLKVGGPAEIVAEARGQAQLIEAMGLVKEMRLPFVMVAGGSNMFFADKGFKGVVIHYTSDEIVIDKKNLQAEVDAGCNLRKMIERLADENLGGIDFLANIPGSLGGGVVGNAGCYGLDIADYLVSVRVYDLKTNKISVWKPSQFKFSYRHSILKDDMTKVVISAILKLKNDKKANIIKSIDAEKALRWQKHPHQPSAGSFFKNIKRGIPAWQFINQAGLKGYTVGGARVSAKHSNHIINIGGATANDLIAVAKHVVREVKAKTGIKLESEARYFDGSKIVTFQ